MRNVILAVKSGSIPLPSDGPSAGPSAGPSIGPSAGPSPTPSDLVPTARTLFANRLISNAMELISKADEDTKQLQQQMQHLTRSTHADANDWINREQEKINNNRLQLSVEFTLLAKERQQF